MAVPAQDEVLNGVFIFWCLAVPVAFAPALRHWVLVTLLASAVVGLAKVSYGAFLSSRAFAWAGYIDPGFKPKVPAPPARPPSPGQDWMDTRDHVYLSLNCLITTVFIYHFGTFLANSPRVSWELADATVWNTLGAALLQFAFYDFFYHWFHRTLHLRALYSLVHKHHHRQKAPYRGVLDGINVHPFEMVVGIYIHLFAVYMVPGHVAAAGIFFGLGSFMAAINHTRWGVKIVAPYFFDVRDHDMHHVYPNCNYAQCVRGEAGLTVGCRYVMWWDKLLGTFKDHPKSRPPLDQNTGVAKTA